ncbi:MAG: hypothetical protein RIT24_2635, partial [Planctomycetota bacterium]
MPRLDLCPRGGPDYLRRFGLRDVAARVPGFLRALGFGDFRFAA